MQLPTLLLLLYCCFTAALLLLYCCFTAALLLLYCCFTHKQVQMQTLNPEWNETFEIPLRSEDVEDPDQVSPQNSSKAAVKQQ
jgi:hypothetical protein